MELRKVTKNDIITLSELSFFPDVYIDENSTEVVDENGEVDTVLTESLNELARLNKRRIILKKSFGIK